MKKKHSLLTAILLSVTLCSGFLCLVALLLTPAQIGKSYTPADDEILNVPYYSLPENKTILISGESGEGALLYLNFSDIALVIHLFDKNCEEEAQKLGYIIDYTMTASDKFLCSLCDRIGGIEMGDNGETYRYLGSSLRPLLQKKPSYESMLKISEAFFEKFSKIGLSSADFMFIMENTTTNLNYPTCYDWLDFLPELICNCIYN